MSTRSRRLLLACTLLLVLATGLLLALNHAKLESTLEKRARDRQTLIASELAKALQAHLALGLSLEDTPALRASLQRTLALDPQTRALAVLNGTQRAVLVVGQGDAPLWQAAVARGAGGASANGTTAGTTGYARDGTQHAALALPLRDAYNLVAGHLVAEYGLAPVHAQARAALWDGVPLVAGALLLSVLLLWLVGRALAPADAAAGPVMARANRRLSALVTALVLVVQGVIAWNGYRAFDRIAAEDAPVLAATMAHTVRPALERALALDVPIEQLVGVREWLEPLLRSSAVFSAVELRTADGGTVLHAAALPREPAAPTPVQFSQPVQHRGETVGQLVVHLDLAVLAERARQLGIEFVTLFIAAALLVHEAVRWVNQQRQPGAAGELAALRTPLFLFFLASELPRSFLPVWSSELATRPLPTSMRALLSPTVLDWVDRAPDTLLATVPISAFLLSVALASPWAGRVCTTRGSGHLLRRGLLLAMLGHGLAMMADSLLLLCLARMVAGASFGFVSIAAFDVIGRQNGGRAVGMALYLAAYVAGGVCGSGLGALLADRSGFGAVFVLGLVCCLLAAALARHAIRVGVSGLALVPPVLASLGGLLRQPVFLRVLVLLALPMQMVQQGLLFYWAPLALASLGENASFVGLAMMGYFLMVLFINGPAARYADRTGRQPLLTVLALLVAGLAALASGSLFAPWVIAAAIVLVGLAWAFGFPSLGAVALHVCQAQIKGVEPALAMGMYRSVERVGAMLAPVLVALLLLRFGPAGAAQAMGVLMLGSALLFLMLNRGVKST